MRRVIHLDWMVECDCGEIICGYDDRPITCEACGTVFTSEIHEVKDTETED